MTDLAFLKKNDPMIMQEVINRIILSNVCTSIPGTIRTFDKTTQIVTVTPNIRMIENKLDGATTKIQMPDLIEVPCLFPYSTTSGFSLTYPVKEGDQCLLIFAQRSIDNWLENGMVQDPIETKYPRSHSLSDGIAIVGLIPKPNAISNFQTDGIELRNGDRTVYIKIKDDNIKLEQNGANIEFKADGSILCQTGTVSLNLNGANIALTSTGNINLTGGNIILGPTTTIDGKPFLPHIHSAGSYEDSFSNPVTGNSGGVV